MGYIERKYIVTEYAYFEDTEENLQAVEDKNFDEVIIDDYASEDDWYSLPGTRIYDDEDTLIKSDNESFQVIDNKGEEIYNSKWN